MRADFFCLPGWNVQGTDINSTYEFGSNQTACVQWCRDSDECTLSVLDNDGGGRCWQKKDVHSGTDATTGYFPNAMIQACARMWRISPWAADPEPSVPSPPAAPPNAPPQPPPPSPPPPPPSPSPPRPPSPSPPPPSPSLPPPPSSGSGGGGMASGAMIGIIAGVLAAVVVAAGLAYFVIVRRR